MNIINLSFEKFWLVLQIMVILLLNKIKWELSLKEILMLELKIELSKYNNKKFKSKEYLKVDIIQFKIVILILKAKIWDINIKWILK